MRERRLLVLLHPLNLTDKLTSQSIENYLDSLIGNYTTRFKLFFLQEHPLFSAACLHVILAVSGMPFHCETMNAVQYMLWWLDLIIFSFYAMDLIMKEADRNLCVNC